MHIYIYIYIYIYTYLLIGDLINILNNKLILDLHFRIHLKIKSYPHYSLLTDIMEGT